MSFKKEALINQFIGELQIKAKLKQKNLQKFYFVSELLKYWQTICGPLLAPNLSPYGMRGHTLVLHAKNHLWSEQARFYEEDLIKNIQKVLPNIKIRNIYFESHIETQAEVRLQKTKIPKPKSRFFVDIDFDKKTQTLLKTLKD